MTLDTYSHVLIDANARAPLYEQTQSARLLTWHLSVGRSSPAGWSGGERIDMKLFVLVGAVLIATLAVPIAGSASAPKYDRASGDGVRSERSPGGSTPSFVLDAKSGPSGEEPQGVLSMDFGTFEGSAKFTVQVTCLRVSGNTATVAGVVSSGQGLDISIGAGFVAVFKDFGVPKGGTSPDQMSGVAWGPDLGTATVQEVCATPFAPGLPEKDWGGLSTRFTNLLSGNINVTDA